MRNFQFLVATLFLAVLFSVHVGVAQNEFLWKEVPASSIVQVGEAFVFPSNQRTYSLSLNEMKALLKSAPMERTLEASSKPLILSVPTPDAGFQRFSVVEVEIMEPSLAAQYPEIHTYAGQGIEDPTATIRLDVTMAGFHAMVRYTTGEYFIDPHNRGDLEHYVLYTKQGVVPSRDWSCTLVADPAIVEEIRLLVESGMLTPTGTQLRTYRLACAATGEYTAFFGGTVALGQAAIVTAINRVNGVYETEVAIRMVLVANNSSVVYTNSSTDPFTNNNGSTMLGQNQTNMNSVIGSANYDIGHVFSTGGGGVAYLGCVCTSNKARGVTGSSSPTGDAFWIDYVAHEMGHQFGGNHTFNSVTSNCGGGNRNASTAYEPGSGTTIMAYAGICGADNIQLNSDAFFHTKSFDEIVAYTNFGSGNSCAATTNTGNNAPAVNAGVGGFTIPISTPFILTGSATDPNGDPLTYCWEEFDLGPSGSPNSPSGNAPIFRSFSPVTSPSRTFPRQSNLLNNTQTIGEILPSYGRSLTFRLTARDNRSGGGGVDYASLSFNVSGTAGPFLVTAPNSSVNWTGNTTQAVTWNVANTSTSPVSCANVKISLSTDGGQTFPTVLAASTPNDGTEALTIPNTPTTTARIKVEAVGNIFFDISNSNFTITASTLAAPTLVFPSDNATGQPVSLSLRWNTVATATSYRLQVGTDSTFASGLVVHDSTLTDTTRLVNGITTGTKYFWRVQAKNGSITGSWSSLRRFTTIAPPPAVTLVSPLSNATEQNTSVDILWRAASQAGVYRLQLATDSLFIAGIVIDDSSLADTSFSANGLLTSTAYFWRVRASNDAGEGSWSVVRKFTTVTPPGTAVLLFPSNNATGILQTVVLVWNTIPRATEYKLQLATDSTFATGIVIDDSTTTDTSYVVSGLSYSEQYFWRVRGANVAGEGTPSPVRRFSTLFPPAVVMLASPQDGSTGQPVSPGLQWQTTAGASVFLVQLSTDSVFSGGMVVDDSTVTDTLRVVNGLNPGTTYFWHVMASNAAGDGGWSTSWRFTTASLPSPVVLLSPLPGAEVPSDTVAVTWETVTGVDAYWLEWSEDSLFTVSFVDSTLIDTAAMIRNLADSSTYYWRVRAGNGAGWGPFSETRPLATLFKIQVCMPLQDRWNLVSVPVGTDEDSVQILFPDCGSQPAYSYTSGSGYSGGLTMQAGRGYWVKCTSGSVCMTGTSISRDTIVVLAGWNLIGTISDAVPASAITTIPSGIVESPFYMFQNGYQQAGTIQPGRAYWVKVRQSGAIVLDSNALVVAKPATGKQR